MSVLDHASSRVTKCRDIGWAGNARIGPRVSNKLHRIFPRHLCRTTFRLGFKWRDRWVADWILLKVNVRTENRVLLQQVMRCRGRINKAHMGSLFVEQFADGACWFCEDFLGS